MGWWDEYPLEDEIVEYLWSSTYDGRQSKNYFYATTVPDFSSPGASPKQYWGFDNDIWLTAWYIPRYE